MRRCLLFGFCVLALTGPAGAQEVMYGSTNNGELGVVDQMTGAFTTLGNPATGIGKEVLSGVSFDASGRLWGTVPFDATGPVIRGTILIEIDPATGQLIDEIGPIEDTGGQTLRITDLATQPSTDRLFGVAIRGSQVQAPAVYIIDKATAVATFVGETFPFGGGLAFAPDGRLFFATTSSELARLDPATAQTIGNVIQLAECVDGLGIRPSDGAFFATECDGIGTFRIDPTNGDLTPLDSGEVDVTDLAFQLGERPSAPVPALSVLALTLAVAVLAGVGGSRLYR